MKAISSPFIELNASFLVVIAGKLFRKSKRSCCAKNARVIPFLVLRSVPRSMMLLIKLRYDLILVSVSVVKKVLPSSPYAYICLQSNAGLYSFLMVDFAQEILLILQRGEIL